MTSSGREEAVMAMARALAGSTIVDGKFVSTFDAWEPEHQEFWVEAAEEGLRALLSEGLVVLRDSLQHVGWHNTLHPGEFVTHTRRPPYPWEPVYRVQTNTPETRD